MSGFLWKMVGALVAGMLGLAMLFWALELTALAALEGTQSGTDGRPETSVYVLMFAGLALVNLSTFSALTRWSRYLREHPRTKQLPVVLLVSVLLVVGAASVIGVAVHSDWLHSQDPIPTTVQQGFIAYQVVFGALAVATLVLLAVRWSPGFRRRPIED